MAVLPLDESSTRFAGSSPRAIPSRRMESAARSFTEPPGLSHSALRSKVGEGRWRLVEVVTGMSGVLPTNPHSAGSRLSTAGALCRAMPPAAAVFTPLPSRSAAGGIARRSEEHTSELQSLAYLVCRLLLEKK